MAHKRSVSSSTLTALQKVARANEIADELEYAVDHNPPPFPDSERIIKKLYACYAAASSKLPYLEDIDTKDEAVLREIQVSVNDLPNRAPAEEALERIHRLIDKLDTAITDYCDRDTEHRDSLQEIFEETRMRVNNFPPDSDEESSANGSSSNE